MKIYKPNKLIIDNLKYKSKKQVIVYDIFVNNNFVYIIFNPNYVSNEELKQFIFQQKINNNYETCTHIESMIDGERKTEWCRASGEGCGVLKYEYKSEDFIFKYKSHIISGKIYNLNNFINKKTLTVSTLVHYPNYKFLKHWLEYYHCLGVDSFIIYLNDYDEEKELVLMSLIDTDKYNILFVDWNVYSWSDGFELNSFHSAQPESLNHCLYSLNSIYNIFVDVDEYIVLKKHKNLFDFILEYNNYTDIEIINRWCGSNQKNVTDILFNEVFCSSECTDGDINRRKTIVLNKNNIRFVFVHGNQHVHANSILLNWDVVELRHYIDFSTDNSKKSDVYNQKLKNYSIQKGLTYENRIMGS